MSAFWRMVAVQQFLQCQMIKLNNASNIAKPWVRPGPYQDTAHTSHTAMTVTKREKGLTSKLTRRVWLKERI